MRRGSALSALAAHTPPPQQERDMEIGSRPVGVPALPGVVVMR